MRSVGRKVTVAKPRFQTRNPWVRAALIASVAALGIGSRWYAAALPGVVAAYAGDTLWAWPPSWASAWPSPGPRP